MSNNQLPADVQENKWEVQEWGEESYALTNGSATLVTSDASDEGYLSAIVDLLNGSGYRFHSESKIEIDLHCEAEMCKLELSEWKERAKELEAEAEKAQKLVDALEEIASGKVLPQLIAQQVLQQWKDRKEVELTCMVCGSKFMGPEPKMCCSGRDCGCMGLPTEPIVCSKECYEKGIPPQKGDSEVAIEID